MSWLYSQALVAEFSAVTCSDGDPSAQLNVMPTQHKFWRNDKTMEPSQLSRPTPTVCGNYNRKGASKTSGDGLVTAVKTWATPVEAGDPLPQQVGGILNPNWVEWLMGWPIGWTDLKPLETGKSHSAPLQPSEFSPLSLTEAG